MRNSKIRWTDHSWNTVIGCSKVSEGCRNCYAETMALKWNLTPLEWTAKNAPQNVILKPHKLGEPAKIKEPSMIFVNSMSDFFHEQIEDDYLDKMMEVMLGVDRHTYQVLTKRPARMVEYLKLNYVKLPEHIWWGVSIESRKHLDRLELLKEVQTPIRFVSFEPLLEDLGEIDLTGVHWAIVGGESGDNFRPMEHAWARNIRDACLRDGTEFYFKQSANRYTERGKSLVEADGSKTVWEYFPVDGQRYHDTTPNGLAEPLEFRFDGYYQLDETVQLEIERFTEKLKSLISDLRLNIFEIGKYLAEVQAILANHHKGTFQSWLDESFGWGKNTAYRFISVYKAFGSCPNLTQLSIDQSSLYLLAKEVTPDAAREEAIERAEDGEKITHAKAKEIVEKHTDAEPKPPETPEAVAERLKRRYSPSFIAQLREVL